MVVVLHITPVNDSVGQSVSRVSILAISSPATLFYLDPDQDHTDSDLEPFHASDHLTLHPLHPKVMVRRDEGVVLPQRGALKTLSSHSLLQIQPISTQAHSSLPPEAPAPRCPGCQQL